MVAGVFIECIWPSVLREFAAIIKRSNPMVVSGPKPSRGCELRCEIIGDTLIIERTSITNGMV